MLKQAHIKISILLTPKPKASVRLGKFGAFNPSNRGMKATREIALQQMNDVNPLEGPLLVIVHFKIPAALSLPNWKRVKMHTKQHMKKPDADNLEKFLNDSLNGVVWKDDAQVSWLIRNKSITHDTTGSTDVHIISIPDENLTYKEIFELALIYVDD